MHQFTEKRIVTSGSKVKDITNVSHGRKLQRACELENKKMNIYVCSIVLYFLELSISSYKT